MGIIAIIRMRNSSSFPIMIGDVEIPPQTEEDVELEMQDPDGEFPEVKRTLSVQWGNGKNLNLKIMVPFNRGILLKTQRRYVELLLIDEHFSAGILVLLISGCNMVNC